MTRDEIIKMAREAGLERNGYWEFDMNRIERFFHAAYAAGAEAEREACLDWCAAYAADDGSAQKIEAAIRARSEK